MGREGKGRELGGGERRWEEGGRGENWEGVRDGGMKKETGRGENWNWEGVRDERWWKEGRRRGNRSLLLSKRL